jgi:phosphatidylserine/phosphatidylglycerophosphate/cardiolipin synthase-like enzyme
MLRGIKRFRSKDEGMAAGTPVPLDEHPVQSFGWGDYTCKPGLTYDYRIVPVYGKPKLLELRDASAVTVRITTEQERQDREGNPVAHDVYFNRGIVGSQAYARKFGNANPDPDDPESREMKWLSRGLYEALLGFIGLAQDQRFALRGAFYEFHFVPAAMEFLRAHERGVDVKIVYDCESTYKDDNIATLTHVGLYSPDLAIARTVTEGIRHNKFLVLVEDDVPVAVWTGSTNLSAGGIFGHSNVGHVVWDRAVAKAYLDYWQRLADNLTPTKLRPLNAAATPTPVGRIEPGSIVPLFSARDAKDSEVTLAWYAARMAEAREIMCFTVAFNLDALFQPFLQADNDVLRYIVKDDDLAADEHIGRDRDVLFAAGGYLGGESLTNFRAERDNPLNSNNYIHNKFMLVDPLSDDPFVVTGSANFSRPSQTINDENMLAIRGDKRVADIYFGEFMRIFDHHYARYVVRKLTREGTNDPNAGYLKERTEDWLPAHLDPASHKSKRRRYFVRPTP